MYVTGISAEDGAIVSSKYQPTVNELVRGIFRFWFLVKLAVALLKQTTLQ